MPQNSDLAFLGTQPVNKGDVRQFVEKLVPLPVLAANADAEVVVDVLNQGKQNDPLYLESAEIISGVDVAAHASDTRTFTLYNRLSDGSGTDALAALATSAEVSIAKYVPSALTIDRTKYPPKGKNVLTLAITHGANGKALSGAALLLRYRG